MISTKIRGFFKNNKALIFSGIMFCGTVWGLTNRTPPPTVELNKPTHTIEDILPTDIETTSMTVKKIENVLKITYAIIDSDVIFEDLKYTLNLGETIMAGKVVKTLSGYFGRRYSTQFLLTLDPDKFEVENKEDNVINIKYDEEDIPVTVSYIITEISPLEYDGSTPIPIPFIKDIKDWIITISGNNSIHLQGAIDYRNGLDIIMKESIEDAESIIKEKFWKKLLADTINQLKEDKIKFGEGVPEVIINTDAIKKCEIQINEVPIKDISATTPEVSLGENIQLEHITLTGLRIDNSTRDEYEEQKGQEEQVTGPKKRSLYLDSSIETRLVVNVEKEDSSLDR